MKRKAAFIISVLCAFAAVGSTPVYAAVGGTIYPEDGEFVKTLEFTALTDYAVEDGLYAFADGKHVKVFKNGQYLKSPPFDGEVTSLAIKDAVIYCGLSDGQTYAVASKNEKAQRAYLTQDKCEYTFEAKKTEILYDGYYYFTDDDGLNVFNKSTKENTAYNGKYGDLKLFGEKVYAICDNVLYSFTGLDRKKVALEYVIDEEDLKIAVGQSASALKSFTAAQFVEISAGAYKSSVDLTKLDGEYFGIFEILKAENAETALLLCYSGNAAVVARGDDAYLVHKDKIVDVPLAVDGEKPFETAQLLGDKIYASPYIADGTISLTGATGKTVKILRKLENKDVLGSVFYEIEYSSENATARGYVAEGFLSPVAIEDDKAPVLTPDPEYSESNDTKTILIVFAVVLLVLAAIGYISHVGAKDKKKRGKKKPKEEETP